MRFITPQKQRKPSAVGSLPETLLGELMTPHWPLVGWGAPSDPPLRH